MLSGVLYPSGEFWNCKTGSHIDIAKIIIGKEGWLEDYIECWDNEKVDHAVEYLIKQKNFIYFSDFGARTDDGYIEFGNEINPEQRKFIKSNYIKMSEGQRRQAEQKIGSLY
jgi:hypothetical protein